MSSVQYTDKCGVCGGVREEYYDFENVDFHSVCYSCGTSHTEAKTSAGKIITEDQGGFGTCLLMFTNQTCQLMVVPERITEDAKERFLKLMKLDPSISSEGSRLTAFEDGKLKAILGKLPLSYEQYKNDLFSNQPFQ